MSPALRKPSPRVTSPPISARDRLWFAADGAEGTDAGGDTVFGTVCCASCAGEAMSGSGACADCVTVDPAAGDGDGGLAASCASGSAVAGNVTPGAGAAWPGSGTPADVAPRGAARSVVGARSAATGGALGKIGADSLGGISLGADCGGAVSRGS